LNLPFVLLELDQRCPIEPRPVVQGEQKSGQRSLDRGQGGENTGLRGVVGIADVVTKNDEQDGQAAEAVELGDTGGEVERTEARRGRQRRTPCD
jgi:hypothetical protein